jgi:hypothetical protein
MYFVYSIAINDYIEEDTINFYFIGGRYLVPSSEILYSVWQRRQDNVKIPITVSSSYKAITNDDYDKEKGKENIFWTSSKQGKKMYWQPTDQNKQLFKNIVGKEVTKDTVSIRSNIDYSYFINPKLMGSFGLW